MRREKVSCFRYSRDGVLSGAHDAGLKLYKKVTRTTVLPVCWAQQHSMAPIAQMRADIGRSSGQPAVLILQRRASLRTAVSCRGSNGQQKERQRFDFQYRKSLLSMRFRKLLEKADRVVHRAQPAIQAVAQAEQQVGLHSR